MFIEKVFADSNADKSIFGGEPLDMGELLLLIVSLLVLFSSIATIIFILRGGVLVILSGGKPDKIKPAINTIRYAFFGLVVIVAALFIFPIIARLLGLDVEEYLQPKAIFAKINELGDKVFGNGSGSGTDTTSDIPKQDDGFIDEL